MLLLPLFFLRLGGLGNKVKCWIRFAIVFYTYVSSYFLHLWLCTCSLVLLIIREMNSSSGLTRRFYRHDPPRLRRLNTCGYLFRTNGGASLLIDRFRLIRVSATHFKTGLTVLRTFRRLARCGPLSRTGRQLLRNEIGKFTLVCTKIAEETSLVYS